MKEMSIEQKKMSEQERRLGEPVEQHVKVLNPWRSTELRLEYYTFDTRKEIAREGEYAVYAHPSCVVYTYKNIAVGCSVKFNKEHFNAIVNRKRPVGENDVYTPATFRYERFLHNLKLGEKRLKQHEKLT